MTLPPVVTAEAWQRERDALLVKEKEATRALDTLAAERRRLPMVRMSEDYAFEGPDGEAGLIDLFDGRRQLVVYHFMFPPGDDHPCTGCSSFTDNIGHLAHLHARDTSLALTSRAPPAELTAYRERMGWSVPWYSAPGRLPPRSRHRGRVRPQRVPRRRRRGVPHVLHDCARRRPAADGLQPARPDAARPPGGVGGLARGMATVPRLRLVEPPRRVRGARRRLTDRRAQLKRLNRPRGPRGRAWSPRR